MMRFHFKSGWKVTDATGYSCKIDTPILCELNANDKLNARFLSPSPPPLGKVERIM